MIDLLIQYCNHPNPAREAEFRQCVQRNLNNSWISNIWDLVEPQTKIPSEITNHPKHHTVKVKQWLTYEIAFAFARDNLAGKLVALSNLDIILSFKANWRAAAQLVLNSPVVLALSRHEVTPSGKIFLDPSLQSLAFAISQDIWLFKGGLVVPNSDFEIGTLGCDNAIAHRFREANLYPLNLGLHFHIYHYDWCRGKNLKNQHLIHQAEEQFRPTRCYPENKGYYLLPEAHMIKVNSHPLNIHSLIQGEPKDLSVYDKICHLFTRNIIIRHG